MTASRRATAGFSLVELLIVGGVIFVLVNGVTLVLAQSGKQVWERAESGVTTVSDAQRALDRITEDLQNARQANLSCQTAVSATCITPPCLVFDLADGSGRVTYQLSVIGQVLRTLDQGQPQVVGSGLTDFTPTCLPNSLVKLDVTAEATARTGTQQYTLATRPMTSTVFVQNP